MSSEKKAAYESAIQYAVIGSEQKKEIEAYVTELTQERDELREKHEKALKWMKGQGELLKVSLPLNEISPCEILITPVS